MANINELNNDLKQTQVLAKQAYRELEKLNRSLAPSTGASAGANEATIRKIAEHRSALGGLIAEYTRLEKAIKNSQRASAGRSPYTTIGDPSSPVSPTPPPKPAQTAGFRNLDASLSRFQAALDSFVAKQRLDKSLLSTPKIRADGGYGYATMDYYRGGLGGAPEKIKVVLDQLGNFGKSVASINNKVFLNTEQGKRVAAFAETMGFEARHLKSVTRTPGSPYGIANFRRSNQGVQEISNLRFDQLGNTTTTIPTRKDQRSALQEVRRDLGDLLKWSIAITAIYAPINALSEAMAQLIVNETELADVSVALGDEVATTSVVFDQVFASSQKAGESVQGVIESFGQAYRAAGRVSNETQRYNTAVTLLNDSLVLSKLSTLDQVGAIDVLTAALYQTASAGDTEAQSLSRGRDLLDKWVRVSKIAAVDVETLATGVAVLGDSAETAGLDVEHLNALIATIAETSLSGGKEAANIAKALVGNYQSDSAVKELGRLGISVTDVTGKTRQFLDVMTEVAAMRQSGIIQNEDFNRLTLALGGGGIRRQKDVAAFIENFGRMQQIAGAQAGASGEASEALAKKLDTVQTSATKLTNSFQNLVQSMGDEGGLLDAFSSSIDFGTTLVNVLDQIISRAGKVGPLLLGVAAAFALFRKTDITAALINNTGISLGAAETLTGRRSVFGQPVSPAFTGGRFSPGGAFSQLTSLPTAAAIALPAIQNFRSGDKEEGIANIIGGGIGALAGGPVGALVGSAIAEAFVRSTLTYETAFVNFFAGVNDQLSKTGAELGKARSEEDLQKEAFKSLGLGSEGLGKFLAQVGNFALSDSARDIYKYLPKGATTQGLTQIIGSIPGGGSVATDPVKALRGVAGVGGEFNTVEAFTLEWLKRNNPKLYEEFQSVYASQGGTLPGIEAPLTSRQNALSQRDSEYLKGLQSQRQSELTKQLVEGEIKPSDYARRTAALSAFSVSATKSASALVDETGKLPEEFGNIESAYKDLLDVYSSGNDEIINQVNQQVDAVAYLQNLYDNWKPSVKEMEFRNPLTGEMVTGDRAAAGELLNTARGLASQTIGYGADQIRLQQYKQPEIFGSYTTPSFKNEKELSLVVSEALKAQEAFYRSPEGGNMSADEYDAFIDSLEDLTTAVGDSGDYFYRKITEGVDRKFFDETYKRLQDENKISGDGEGKPWNVVSATAADVKRAEALAPGYVRKLEEHGYESEITEAIFSTSDDQIVSAKGDQKVIQYLLQQILDTEKKQLQGIYNLPDGATAWVPYDAAMLGVEDETNLDDLSMATDSIGKLAEQVAGGQSRLFAMEEVFGKLEQGRRGPSKQDAIDSAREETMKDYRSGEKDYYSQPGEKERPFFEGLQGGTKERDSLDLFRNWMPTADKIGTKMGGENAQPINTKLDIKFTSTTQLIVDGRALATVIKPYLAADLLRTNESGGTTTRSYVI